MMERNRKALRRRIRAHTLLAMIDCANHGCDFKRTARSERRLLEFIEEMVEHERMVAHSAGYAEGRTASRENQ